MSYLKAQSITDY